MTLASPMMEIADLIAEAGGNDLRVCMQCGTCTAVCPWPTVKEFSPRRVLRRVSLGLEGYEAEDIWNCVNCRSCVQRCPRALDMIEVVRATRSVLMAGGQNPRSWNGPLGSLRAEGNPWSGSRQDRGRWAQDLALKPFDETCEWLLFTCCTQAYDPRNRSAARALVPLLQAAGVTFGVLGSALTCCGEQAQGAGALDLAQELLASNREVFDKHSVRKVIVSSPHCLKALKGSGPDGAPLQVSHAVQLLDTLIANKRLVLSRPVPRRVTWHDPCYLGRHAGEFEAPRRVLHAIPGLELVEMRSNRSDSLCCGGGAGGSWREVPPEQRFALHRVREAQAAGADMLVTGCPYCIAMFEDAVKVLELEGKLEVRDIAELVLQSAFPA
jgi:Fe-S oxidoreductase